MMKTVGLYTLGCKVSQYETEAVGEAFEAVGYTVVPFDDVADAYVINTCTVTRESDRKSRQIIRRAIDKNPNAVIAVIGCYSQRSPQEVAAIGGVDIVIGTDKKLEVVGRVEKLLMEGRKNTAEISAPPLEGIGFEPMQIKRAPRTRAYVKIEDGCESRCTYCAISSARGPVRSKPREAVIEEVEALYKAGTREIVLTGIETGSYGSDFENEYTLADLIAELDERGSAERIRLGSLAPELIGKKFVDKVKDKAILAPHFHLSVQSGSSSVLRNMKRRYNREMALENIEYIKRNIKNAQFTTDMMVGFPGETEEDFLETVDFVRRARFLDVHVFAYSRRENTPAAYFKDQVDEATKKRRSRELIRVKNEVRDEILSELCERRAHLSVILENCINGVYTAHSDSYIEVKVELPEGLSGEALTVEAISHSGGIILAKPINC